MSTASQGQNSDIGQMLYANKITDSAGEGHSNPASGFAVNSEGGAGGMNKMSLFGEEGVDTVLGVGKEGAFSSILEAGAFGNLINDEGALNFNLVAGFEKFLPGLTKSECFAIKSMGMLATLNALSIKSQLGTDLKGKTSIIGGHEQGG
jgi:hypothetical protein